MRSANSRMSLSGRPRTKQYGPRSSNAVTCPSPLIARPTATACSACSIARCAPVAPFFGPPKPTESAGSPTAAATRERTVSARARASIGASSSRSATTVPPRARMTRAGGASSVTTTRRRAPTVASRDATAIATYSPVPLVAASSGPGAEPPT